MFYANKVYIDGKEIKNIVIPDGVTKINNYAFFGCHSLTSVTIPNSVTSIGLEAFYKCSGLTSVTIPNSVTSIGSGVFRSCSGLTSVVIPDEITTIGESTFASCSKLKDVKLPEKLYMIKKQAFYNCKTLESITIPAGVEYIYQEAFKYCNSLKNVKVLAETPPFAYDNSFSNYDAELSVPEKSITAYQETSPWSKFSKFNPLVNSGISNVKALPVVVQVDGGILTVSGADDGTLVEVYTIAGAKVGSDVTSANTATVNISHLADEVIIVKVANKAIKVMMK